MTDEHPIGIWGPTKAGKTTYIVALKQYITHAKNAPEDAPEYVLQDSAWRVHDLDTETTRMLLKSTDDFIARGKFPEAMPYYPVIWLVKGKSTVPWGQRIQLN